MISHFVKAGIPHSTLYRILTKYAEHGKTTFFLKSGRPTKISTQQVKTLVKTVNNKTGISQRKLARRFAVSQSTISRVLKRKSVPKYSGED
jgi:transposase